MTISAPICGISIFLRHPASSGRLGQDVLRTASSAVMEQRGDSHVAIELGPFELAASAAA